MQVVHLIRKDFLLVKKYWLVMLVCAFGIPLFIQTRTNLPGANFMGFFLSTVYIQYILFNFVSLNESKYKGTVLLCALPYTRKAVVVSKYAFLGVIFLASWLVNVLLAAALPGIVHFPGFFTAGMTGFIVSILFGILIPIQYRFGYEKSRFMFAMTVFTLPFILPVIVKWLQEQQLTIRAAFPFSYGTGSLVLAGMALLMIGSSLAASVRIFSGQSL